mgnify:CR=1 FL=1
MRRFLPVFLFLLSFSATAHGADIYINGTLVRGITDLTLEDCKVTFTATGDIYVEAPGYKVLEPAAKADQVEQNLEASGKLKHRYFLFAHTEAPGKIPFAFDVLVNGVTVKEFDARLSQVTQEITLNLKPGKNVIAIKAHYQPSEGAVPSAKYQIYVGRGQPVNGSLEINEVLVEYTQKGSDTASGTRSFDVNAE